MGLLQVILPAFLGLWVLKKDERKPGVSELTVEEDVLNDAGASCALTDCAGGIVF